MLPKIKASAKQLNDSMHYLKQKRAQQMSLPSQSTAAIPLNEKIGYEVTSNKIIYKVAEGSTAPHTNEEENESQSSESGVDISGRSRDTQTDTGLLYDTTIAFINTFLIRAFSDFFTHKEWIDRIQKKIQNKLSMIDVPYFMEELKITGIDLGTVVPLIKQTSEPWYDERGLWVHLEIDYSGGKYFNQIESTI